MTAAGDRQRGDLLAATGENLMTVDTPSSAWRIAPAGSTAWKKRTKYVRMQPDRRRH